MSKLQEARDLLAQPGAWIRGLYAKDATGNWVEPMSDRAICWCSIGALHKVYGIPTQTQTKDDDEFIADYDLLNEAVTAITNAQLSPATYNDKVARDVQDILVMYDYAIGLSKNS